MIYITGDMHGDRARIKRSALKGLKKGDHLIVCGDFGFIWDGSRAEKRLLKRLGKRKYHILFVDGAHENHELLEKYPTENWQGGKTRVISGNLRLLMRGQVFRLADKLVFAFGGGTPDDGGTRFVPEEREFTEGLEALGRQGNKVDYIVSYEAPSKIAEFLELAYSDEAHLNAYLDRIAENTVFERWFFGHHHMNKIITSKYFAVFNKVIQADFKITRKEI